VEILFNECSFTRKKSEIYRQQNIFRKQKFTFNTQILRIVISRPCYAAGYVLGFNCTIVQIRSTVRALVMILPCYGTLEIYDAINISITLGFVCVCVCVSVCVIVSYEHNISKST